MGFQKTAVAVLVAVLLPAPAFAQSGTGTMAAAVTDPTAGALPGVAARPRRFQCRDCSVISHD
jgi:hypothetical protein